MVKFLLAAVLFIGISAGVNAQSKEDCSKVSCSKDKAEVTKVSKHCDVPETVSKETTETVEVAGAQSEGKSDKVVKVDTKIIAVSDVEKDDKGCCSADKKKTDDPNK